MIINGYVLRYLQIYIVTCIGFTFDKCSVADSEGAPRVPWNPLLVSVAMKAGMKAWPPTQPCNHYVATDIEVLYIFPTYLNAKPGMLWLICETFYNPC